MPIAKAILFTAVIFLLYSNPAGAQIAKGKCKFLGNIISNSVAPAYTTYWDQVTPENSGKWGSVESVRDVMQWESLDVAYNFAKTNGLPFKQHNFVWGQQQPAWLATLDPAEQKEEVEEWIQSYCERYPETTYIDVVNEPLHAVPGYAEALGGSGATGWDWVIWSFEKTKEYCPNAKLILNDYNIVSDNAATDKYLAIINLLKDRHLIDYIGEQGHFMETTPLATITQNLNKLSATGIPILISEFDVNIADDTQQRDKYQQLFPVFWGHKSVHGITLWGFRQGQIWRENAYLIRLDGSERPALTWLKSYVPSVPGGSFCNPVTGEDKGLGKVDIHVYPNPVHEGKLTVNVPEGLSTIEILTVQGTPVKRFEVDQTLPFNVNVNVASGIYIVKITRGQNVSFERIMVTHSVETL